MEKENREIHWSSQLEDLIAKEGEKCLGLAKLHQQAEVLTSRRNNYIQLPVIVLSTLAGVGSTASSSLFEGYEKLSSIVIGLVSIGVGILNTLGGYFAFARKSEGHHIAYLHYSKLFSWIAVELSLPREERMSPQQMLKELRTSMERLAETTPLPPLSIIQQFNRQYKEYKDVSKPSETNGLQKIIVYRNNPLHSRDEQTPNAFGTRDSSNTERTVTRGQEVLEVKA
jgi:hypothetical protein